MQRQSPLVDQQSKDNNKKVMCRLGSIEEAFDLQVVIMIQKFFQNKVKFQKYFKKKKKKEEEKSKSLLSNK